MVHTRTIRRYGLTPNRPWPGRTLAGQYVVGSCLYYFETSTCIFLPSSVQATWPSGHLAVNNHL